ncbi:MAG: hypothetical protein QMD14_00900 [Candidatus Aenigmarchaeota archaeon]|nr:hypothetical protein [Candidatus Aenigmarchaeota archaeon]
MKDESLNYLIISSLLVFLLLAVVAVIAQTSDTDTATVDVVVANLTIIDISPNAVTFSDINPGAVSSADTTFDLENLGSKPIDYITADIIGLPTSNPFETGSAANYYAGNFLAISVNKASATADPTETDVDKFEFVRTRNFNESDDTPRYLTVPTGNFNGRFRFDNEEFFFAATPSAGYYGNGTLYIGTAAHNDANLGDVDVTDNGVALTFYTSAADTPHVGYADVTISLASGDQKYCAIVNATTATAGYVDLARFTADAISKCGTGAADGGKYIVDAGADQVLQPGQSKGLNLGVRIAYGVYQGSLSQSTLEITATSTY